VHRELRSQVIAPNIAVRRAVTMNGHFVRLTGNGVVGTFAPTHARCTGTAFEPEASRVQGERSTVELRPQNCENEDETNTIVISCYRLLFPLFPLIVHYLLT
jgi:hypothetical protein